MSYKISLINIKTKESRRMPCSWKNKKKALKWAEEFCSSLNKNGENIASYRLIEA